MDKSLSPFICTLYVVVGVLALGLVKDLVVILEGLLIIALVVAVFGGLSWLLAAWPTSRQKIPKQKIHEEKNREEKTPRWLRILEEDEEGDED